MSTSTVVPPQLFAWLRKHSRVGSKVGGKSTRGAQWFANVLSHRLLPAGAPYFTAAMVLETWRTDARVRVSDDGLLSNVRAKASMLHGGFFTRPAATPASNYSHEVSAAIHTAAGSSGSGAL